MSDGVWAAMREAESSNVHIGELQEVVGRRLSKLLGVPGAYVTSGAAGALLLGTAACLIRDDLARAEQLPHIVDGRRNVVLQFAHRDPYDHAVTAAGARLVTVGYPRSTQLSEFRAALTKDVAAVLWRPGRGGHLLNLAATSEAAHAMGIPVIVDAALAVPPITRLQEMFADGADLVAVSGGKGLRGPQNSGLLCGRPNLLTLAALQHQDLDERPETWRGGGKPPIEGFALRHGIGRPAKVAREQVAGLLVAVEEHLRGSAHPGRGQELRECYELLDAGGLLDVARGQDPLLDVPVLHIGFPSGVSVDEVSRRLFARNPRVVLGEDEAWRGRLVVNPMALLPGDGRTIAASLAEVVTEMVGVSRGTAPKVCQ